MPAAQPHRRPRRRLPRPPRRAPEGRRRVGSSPEASAWCSPRPLSGRFACKAATTRRSPGARPRNQRQPQLPVAMRRRRSSRPPPLRAVRQQLPPQLRRPGPPRPRRKPGRPLPLLRRVHQPLLDQRRPGLPRWPRLPPARPQQRQQRGHLRRLRRPGQRLRLRRSLLPRLRRSYQFRPLLPGSWCRGRDRPISWGSTTIQ